ncbi:ATP-dependent RNA helicase [Ramaria rubella]|nr:ATP-dependent RNA helicase [Ramaria rubella]
MVATQPDKVNKTKTKAKERYLKVKRDRRKKKKAAEALHKSIVQGKIDEKSEKIKIQRNEEPRFSKEDQSSNYDGLSSGAATSQRVKKAENLNLIEPSTQPVQRSSIINVESERPRKRQKIAAVPTARSSPSPSTASSSSRASSAEEDEDIKMAEDIPSIPRSLDVSTAPLAAFPMPSAPVAASQKSLALQGLDPGLIDAEIVDSSRTAPIDSSGTDSLTTPLNLGLSIKTRNRLKELGISELFAVQTALIPFLLPASASQRALYMPYNPPRDVCVSAPTGSGKTLAYVIPILELLSTRIVTRLRALIVLPTRDLVAQVRETFEALCKGRGLKIATATGQHSFSHEQAQLVEDSITPFQSGSSKVDILICTPGRLMDHINGTKNFSLQHLRFLVIDEADRLLTQSFQDWLTQVLAAIRPPSGQSPVSPISSPIINSMPRHDALSPAWLSFPPWRTHIDERKASSCQKLLFSATLTRDPAKISALELREAKYFIVKDGRPEGADNHLAAGETFVFPATLTEHLIVCSSYQKPLLLFYLIHKHGVKNALVFTKSTESTNRLVKLFDCFEDAMGNSTRPIVRAYSSELSATERKSILEKFKSQEITILICSDLISRGIDISHVSHVVSYDAPVDMRKYVHRVGRTARAGRTGEAWSLIEEQEARYFKAMLSDADHLTKVHKLKVKENDLNDLNDCYETAMKVYSSKPGEEH